MLLSTVCHVLGLRVQNTHSLGPFTVLDLFEEEVRVVWLTPCRAISLPPPRSFIRGREPGIRRLLR
jgi:hypothetical protein